MGDMRFPPPANPWAWLHRRKPRASLRQRLERRARELARIERDRFYKAMVIEVCQGRLDESLIQYWEPQRGAVAEFNRQET